MFRFPSYLDEVLVMSTEKREMTVHPQDPELLAAARKGAGCDDAKPPHPSELVGVAVYAVVDGVPREIGVVLDYTSDSVVVGVKRAPSR